MDDDFLESSGGNTAFNFDSSKKSEPGQNFMMFSKVKAGKEVEDNGGDNQIVEKKVEEEKEEEAIIEERNEDLDEPKVSAKISELEPAYGDDSRNEDVNNNN